MTAMVKAPKMSRRRRWQLRGQGSCLSCRKRPASHAVPLRTVWWCPSCGRRWVTFKMKVATGLPRGWKRKGFL